MHVARNGIEIETEGAGEAYLLADQSDGSAVAYGPTTREDSDRAVAAAREFSGYLLPDSPEY